MNLSYFKWTMKTEWRGGMIYFGILVAWILLIVAVFPSFQSIVSNPLAETGELKIEEMKNGTYNMTWDKLPGFPYHAVVGSETRPTLEKYINLFNQTGMNNTSLNISVSDIIDDPEKARALTSFLDLKLIYLGTKNQIFFEREEGINYYFVLYLNREGGFYLSEYIDILNLTKQSPFNDYLEGNPVFEGLLGNTALIDFSSYEGFVVLEFLEMWTLLIGIYAAIKGVSLVAKPIDDKSMDILLATGYTRDSMLIQKTLTSVIIIIFLHIGSYLTLALGALAVNEPFPWGSFAMAYLTSVPFALAALAMGIFISSFMSDYRTALWTVLGVLVFQYMFQIVGNIMKSLSWVNRFTLFGYWRPTEIMFGSGAHIVDSAALIGIAIVLFGGAWIYFRKRDLPA